MRVTDVCKEYFSALNTIAHCGSKKWWETGLAVISAISYITLIAPAAFGITYLIASRVSKKETPTPTDTTTTGVAQQRGVVVPMTEEPSPVDTAQHMPVAVAQSVPLQSSQQQSPLEALAVKDREVAKQIKQNCTNGTIPLADDKLMDTMCSECLASGKDPVTILTAHLPLTKVIDGLYVGRKYDVGCHDPAWDKNIGERDRIRGEVKKDLEAKNVATIITCKGSEVKQRDQWSDFSYHFHELGDAPTDEAQQDFVAGVAEVLTIIHNARLNGKSAVIHCDSGQSRSTSFVALYLMVVLNLTFEEGYSYLQNKRYKVDLKNFKDTLMFLEKNVAQLRHKLGIDESWVL